MEKETSYPNVLIMAELRGVDQVEAGFNRIGDAAGNMGEKVSTASSRTDLGFRRLALTSAGMMLNMMQLADITGRLATGQMDLARGAVMLGMNFLQLAAQIWILVGAEKARAVASSVAHGIASLGLLLPVIAAAGAAAVAIGMSATASIPSKQMGGLVPHTGVYLLHAGEYIVPKERVSETFTKELRISKEMSIDKTRSPVTINIYASKSPRETGAAVVDELKRAGVI